ncbi:MAG: hypothetical protein ABI459_05955 [Deltaproteobacteria bacterium]
MGHKHRVIVGVIGFFAFAACTPEPPPFDAPQCSQMVGQSGRIDERRVEGLAVTNTGVGYVNVNSRHTSQVWQCADNPPGTIIRSETTYPGQ